MFHFLDFFEINGITKLCTVFSAVLKELSIALSIFKLREIKNK